MQHIRRANAGDVEAIFAIRRRAILSVSTSYASAELTSWAAHVDLEQADKAVRTAEVWVWADDSGVHGWAQRHGNVVQRLYVEPGQMRQGVGSALLAQVERCIGADGHTHAVLDAGLNSVSFYSARGYAIIVAETRVDRVVPMRKALR